MTTRNLALTERVVYVTDGASLISAVNAARQGTLIICRAGNYGTSMDFTNKNFVGPGYVTIRSEYHNTGGAVFEKLLFNNCSYIKVIGLTITGNSGGTGWICEIQNSDHIEVAHCDIKSIGRDDATDIAWFVYNNSYITFRNNHVHDMGGGGGGNTCDHMYWLNNVIHDFGKSDVWQVSAMSDLTFDGNYVYDIYPLGGNHPDVIQVLTFGFPSPTGLCPRVTIKNNIFIEGRGVRVPEMFGTQCIFVTDDENYVSAPYTDWIIEDNLISCSSIHGISLYDGKQSGLSCKRNYVLRNPKTTGTTEAAHIWIEEDGTSNTVQDNVCTEMTINDSGSTLTHNLEVQWTDNLAASSYDSLFIDAYGGYTPEDFLPVPGSAIDFGSDYGPESVLSLYVANCKGYITVSHAASRTVTFGVSAYPGGKALPPSPLTYSWDLGNGTTSTSAAPVVAYGAAGQYDCWVDVTGSNGQKIRLTKRMYFST